MTEFWKIALSISGAGGVAAFVLWSLYKQWLSLPIFQTLTKKQQFSLFRLFLILTFLFGITALIVFSLQNTGNGNGKPETVKITNSKKYEELPINYGDFTALRQFEQSWWNKMNSEGNSNADAHAFLKALRLVEIVWARKKISLEADQRIAELRSSITELNEEERRRREQSITSIKNNIIASRIGLEYQISAKFGDDLSINSPAETSNEMRILTEYSSENRNRWYGQASAKYSPIGSISFSFEN